MEQDFKKIHVPQTRRVLKNSIINRSWWQNKKKSGYKIVAYLSDLLIQNPNVLISSWYPNLSSQQYWYTSKGTDRKGMNCSTQPRILLSRWPRIQLEIKSWIWIISNVFFHFLKGGRNKTAEQFLWVFWNYRSKWMLIIRAGNKD